MIPIIGILVEINNEKSTFVRHQYVKAIESAGGIPIILPYLKECDTLDYFINLCDGFFFTGGADINPNLYGEKTNFVFDELHAFRDEFEFKIFQNIIKTSKPILGVCRGAQLINVSLGGSLFQDIPSERPSQIAHKQSEPEFSFSHEVEIISNTPLFDLIKKKRMKANSFHHQAIKKLGKGLGVMAKADDGIIEAIYALNDRYIRAYQWHPERLIDASEDNQLLFKEFINACKFNNI